MKIVVLGGAGFIGSAIVDMLGLYAPEHEITVYDNLLYADNYLNPDVDFVRGDIRDTCLLKSTTKNVDLVINLAAIVGDAACMIKQEETIAINEVAAKKLIDFYSGPTIFCSSCSVYGTNKELITEESATNPLSLYEKCKIF